MPELKWIWWAKVSTTLKKSVEEGKVTIEQIDNAARLILNAKYDLGLFHDPYKYCDEKEQNRNFHKTTEMKQEYCCTIFSFTKNNQSVTL
jgi:beta-glucosidase-like glycosyl hydrolase